MSRFLQKRMKNEQPEEVAVEDTKTVTGSTLRKFSRNPAPKSNLDWAASGANVLAESEKEAQSFQARRAYKPSRVYVKVEEAAEVVVLDETFGIGINEHQMQDPKTGYWTVHEACPKNWEPCPICQNTGRESQYIVFLTVQDLRPYKNKKGEEVTHTKKLLPLKGAQLKAYNRLLERHGSLRGLHLALNRDAKKSAASGTPEFIGKLSEEEILAEFGHEQVKGKRQDGTEVVFKEANEDTLPFDYTKIFSKPSAADLRARYGGSPPVGSREDIESDDGHGDFTSELDDEIPF